MRLKGREGIARVIYVTARNRRLVILHAFRKNDPTNTTSSHPDRVIQDERVGTMTLPCTEVRKKWKKDPEFRKEFAALRPEFKLAPELIEARVKTGLSQSEVASRMGTSQPAVARLESSHKPSLKSLERYAAAVGMKPEIHLVAG